MTNSHSKRPSPNKFYSNNNNVNMSFENSSPNVLNRHSTSPNSKKQPGTGSFFANNNTSSFNHRKSPKNALVTSNAINIPTPNKYNNTNNFNNKQSPNSNNRSHRPSPSGVSSPTLRTSPTNGSPSNKFAGSKCFDAPKPDELPKPPSHWQCTPITITAKVQKSCAAQFSAMDKHGAMGKMISIQA